MIVIVAWYDLAAMSDADASGASVSNVANPFTPGQSAAPPRIVAASRQVIRGGAALYPGVKGFV